MSFTPVNFELQTWASARAGLDTFALAGCFPKLAAWEGRGLQLTLRQLAKVETNGTRKSLSIDKIPKVCIGLEGAS